MFIRIDNVNYFVIPDDKSPIEIFNEIFARMEAKRISNTEKRKILSEIKKQLRG